MLTINKFSPKQPEKTNVNFGQVKVLVESSSQKALLNKITADGFFTANPQQNPGVQVDKRFEGVKIDDVEALRGGSIITLSGQDEKQENLIGSLFKKLGARVELVVKPNKHETVRNALTALMHLKQMADMHQMNPDECLEMMHYSRFELEEKLKVQPEEVGLTSELGGKLKFTPKFEELCKQHGCMPGYRD